NGPGLSRSTRAATRPEFPSAGRHAFPIGPATGPANAAGSPAAKSVHAIGKVWASRPRLARGSRGRLPHIPVCEVPLSSSTRAQARAGTLRWAIRPDPADPFLEI